MREGKVINVNCRMFTIFIGRLRTVMARRAAIIGILIAKAKTDGPRQKYGGEHYRYRISGKMHSASDGFYDFHSIKLYHIPSLPYKSVDLAAETYGAICEVGFDF